jgi:hypothetical protein
MAKAKRRLWVCQLAALPSVVLVVSCELENALDEGGPQILLSECIAQGDPASAVLLTDMELPDKPFCWALGGLLRRLTSP